MTWGQGVFVNKVRHRKEEGGKGVRTVHGAGLIQMANEKKKKDHLYRGWRFEGKKTRLAIEVAKERERLSKEKLSGAGY